MTTHIKEKHGEGKRTKCLQCDFTSFRKRNLEKHINAVHENKFSHFCDQCEFKTIHPSNFARHLAKHSKEKDIPTSK